MKTLCIAVALLVPLLLPQLGGAEEKKSVGVCTSPDLMTWTTVVESIAGAAPTGAAFVSENVIAPEAPMRLVAAGEVLVLGRKRFARLVVLRQP